MLVSVRKNLYDANRANIIINNFAKGTMVAVDLSLVLKVGDSFEIRNAQDYYGPLVLRGTYQGGSVSVPMTGPTVARPGAWTGAMSPFSAPEFGTFILIRK